MQPKSYAARVINETDLREQYKEFKDAFVGPIPPAEFLEELMRADDLPDPGEVDLSKLAKAQGSYTAVCAALNNALGRVCPHYEFKVTQKEINADVERGLRPSGSCYPKHVRPKMTSDDWQSVEFFFVMSRTGADPWQDYDPNDHAAAYACKSWMKRARMIVYAKSMFSHQFRTAIYSLGFYGSTARFFRWDRAGAVVTQAFDYTREPKLLAEFMQRYERLDAAERGWDTTAQPTSFEEERLFSDSIRVYLADVRARKVPIIPRMLDSLDWRYPVYKVRLEHSHCGQDGEVLVRRPVYELPSPVGRATIGRIAYHLGEKRLVFLKDIWTTMEDKKLKEVDAYSDLAQQDIAHMPNTLYAGYVKCPEGGRHWTRTQDYCSSVHLWIPPPREWKLREREHMRIAQDLVFPLRYVLNSRMLVQAIRDALVASREANEKLSFMHCDISVGNIMLTADGRGVLNDWDHARKIGSGEFGPVGTLRYLSAAAAGNYNCKRAHIPEDDAESCFWVLLDMCQELFEIDQLEVAPLKLIDDILKDTTGTRKQEFFIDETLHCPQFESGPLNALIREVRALARKRRSRNLAYCDAATLIKAFEKVLAREDWPDADARHRASHPRDGAYDVLECVQCVTSEDLHCYWETEYHKVVPAIHEPPEETVEEKEEVPSVTVPATEYLGPLEVKTLANSSQQKVAGSSGRSATRVASNPVQSTPKREGKGHKRGHDEVEEGELAAQTLVVSNSPVSKRRKIEHPASSWP